MKEKMEAEKEKIKKEKRKTIKKNPRGGKWEACKGKINRKKERKTYKDGTNIWRNNIKHIYLSLWRGRLNPCLPTRRDGPSSISAEVRNFNFYRGIGRVSFVCVLCCVVSGGDPDILLTTDSGRPDLILLSSILSPYRNLTLAVGCKSRGYYPYFGEGKK